MSPTVRNTSRNVAFIIFHSPIKKFQSGKRVVFTDVGGSAFVRREGYYIIDFSKFQPEVTSKQKSGVGITMMSDR